MTPQILTTLPCISGRTRPRLVPAGHVRVALLLLRGRRLHLHRDLVSLPLRPVYYPERAAGERVLRQLHLIGRDLEHAGQVLHDDEQIFVDGECAEQVTAACRACGFRSVATPGEAVGADGVSFDAGHNRTTVGRFGLVFKQAAADWTRVHRVCFNTDSE